VRRTPPALMLVLGLMLVVEARVQAYLDPGAGSMLFQVVLGGAAAVGVLVRLFWRRLTDPLRKRGAEREKQT
jgi:hypothetical protein